MKSHILLFALILTSCSQTVSTEKQDHSSLKASIQNKLNQWHQDAAEAKFKPYFECFASDGIFIGTDASEIWDVQSFKDFSKPYFDKGEAWSFETTDRNIYISQQENVIWFDELLDTWMGQCRGSGVFEKEDNDWKLKHYVLSLTVPNEKMDSVIEVIE